MYVYIEARGHFLRIGKIAPPEKPKPPVPVGTSTPMQANGAQMRRGWHLGPPMNPQVQTDDEVQA